MPISENIVLGAQNKASAAFKEVAADAIKATDGIAGGAKQAKLSLTDIKSGIDLVLGGLRTAEAFGKQAFQWGKEGGAVTQTSESFDGLIDRVGAMPDLLQQLRTASRGTVDDMTLMSSTTTLVMGAEEGLAKSLANATPQLLEMAKAANKLNPQLGSTTFLYESLATGIKRGSPMILDNLGITVRLEEAYSKYAISLGKTAAQLTSAEQKQALLNAVLVSGQVLIQQAGGSVDSAVDSYARLETNVKNLSDRFKRELTPAISESVEGMNTAIAITEKTGSNMLHLYEQAILVKLGFITAEDAARNLAGGMEELERRAEEADRAQKLHNHEIFVAADAAREAGKGIMVMADSAKVAAYEMELFLPPMLEVTEAGLALYSMSGQLAAAISGPLVSAHKSHAETLVDLQREEARLFDELDVLTRQGYGLNSKAVMNLNEKLWANQQAQQDATAAVNEATQAFIFQRMSVGLDGQALLELARAMGQIDEQTYALASSTDALKSDFDAMDGSLDGNVERSKEFAAAVKAFSDNIAAIPFDPTKPGEYQKALDDLAEAAKDGVVTAGELKGIMDALNGLQVKVTVTTNYITTGQPGTYNLGPKGGGRQHGGPVTTGTPYWVGEQGPEPFVPAMPGYVLSRQDAMAAVGGSGTPAKGGTAAPINIVVNNESAAAAAIAWQQIERLRETNLAQSMGG